MELCKKLTPVCIGCPFMKLVVIFHLKLVSNFSHLYGSRAGDPDQASSVWGMDRREALRTSKNGSKWEARDHEQSTIVSRSCYVWLGGFFQREKPRPHHEQSNSPLLELQFRLFVSVPSKDSCMGGIWPPNWLRLLHRCQSWLSEPVQGW